MLQRWRSVWLGVVLAALGVGCSHTPVSRTVVDAFRTQPLPDEAQRNPDLRYLRVAIHGRHALMVLGYTESEGCGTLETWYSSAGEVLQLCDGRLWSTRGLGVDWWSVRYLTPPPDWPGPSTSKAPQFQRRLDIMPGYRFGQIQTLTLRAADGPNRAKLSGIAASDLRWYEESLSVDGRDQPIARYGLRKDGRSNQIVFGEQCLSENLCISWQIWPL